MKNLCELEDLIVETIYGGESCDFLRKLADCLYLNILFEESWINAITTCSASGFLVASLSGICNMSAMPTWTCWWAFDFFCLFDGVLLSLFPWKFKLELETICGGWGVPCSRVVRANLITPVA